MITGVGHIALAVRDVDAAVDFQQRVIGMVETERVGGTSYMTCNDRHHELILLPDGGRRGYDHIGLQVSDPVALEAMRGQLEAAGGRLLGGIEDGEPGVDRVMRVLSPGGHIYKLFCGMETVEPPAPGDRPKSFEHASCKVWNMAAEERFVEHGLGFRFSDRMGFLASWWHCDADHHGIALIKAPKAELSHYAYSWSDLAALGRVADRLKAETGRKCVWGPSRHGPGNNLFLYLKDADGAMIECCAEIMQLTPESDYVPRNWSMHPRTINQWGGPPPPRFILTGFPIRP